MTEQLTLPGFEVVDMSRVDDLAFFRRKSDRYHGPTERLHEAMKRFPALKNEGYTWPARIYTLGRFSLLLKGKPADFGRKVPHRPLELLKTLIALGGREVSVTSLTSALWPDADGDTGQRSFDTTLYRLRKLLGDDNILILRDGRISLASEHCWVDIWVFERMLGKAQRLLRNDVVGKEAVNLDILTEKILSLYQDHFLALEDTTSWSVSVRERLRSKFIHNLLDIGRYWETHGFWDRAIRCYQKGIEVDDLVETFHQRLMFCLLETNQMSEAIAAYRHCRQVLSVILGLQPTAETQQIYQLILRQYNKTG